MPVRLPEGALDSMGSNVPGEPQSGGMRWFPTQGSKWRGLAVALLMALAVALPIVQMRLITWKVPWRNNDLIPISEGVRATLRGEDPYSAAVTARIQTQYFGHPLGPLDEKDEQHFAYPAYGALVFAPFGVLPWKQGRLLFLLVVPLLMALSVPLWLQVLGVRATAGKVAVWTVLALASWPMMWGLRLCQVTLPIAFLVAAGSLSLRRGWDVAAGLLFSLAIVKPQSTGPLLAYLVVWALYQRRWTFPLTVLAGCGSLMAWSQWRVPGWWSHWLLTMQQYARYTKMGLLPQLFFGRWLGGAIVVALAVSGAILLWRMRKADASSHEFAASIALALALTLAVMPTAGGMNYNDVFLLPSVLLALNAAPTKDGAGRARRFVLLLLAASYVGVLLAIVLEVARGASQSFFALPMISLLLLPAATALWMILNGYQKVSSNTTGLEGR